MLKVAFPVGEFFHEHHHHTSEKIECSHSTGEECKHQAHLSEYHQHYHDCVFLQIHNFFTFEIFSFEFLTEKVSFIPSFKEEKPFKISVFSSSRAPPIV